MPPDFLNSREDAVLVVAVLVLAYAFRASAQSNGGLASSFVEVFRSLLHPKLLLLFGSAGAYSAGVVYLAWKLGLWHTTAMKETVYWFIGSAVVLVGNATKESPSDPGYFGKLLRHAVRLTIIIVFIVNLYVFPLLVELVVVPVALLFVMLQAMAESDPQYASIRKFVDGVLIGLGLLLFGYFAVTAVTDFDGLLTRENAEAFLVVPALTLALIPYLAGVAWVSRREQESLRRRWWREGSL